MPAKCCHETLKSQILRRLCNRGFRRIRRHDEAGCCIDAFKYETPGQQLIPRTIRGLLEGRINLEIRLLVAHRRLHPVAVFEQKEIAKEWGRSLAESALPVGNPDIRCAPDGLF